MSTSTLVKTEVLSFSAHKKYTDLYEAAGSELCNAVYIDKNYVGGTERFKLRYRKSTRNTWVYSAEGQPIPSLYVLKCWQKRPERIEVEVSSNEASLELTVVPLY